MKKACSANDEEKDDYNCNYSENIKIVYYGAVPEKKIYSKCGLNAVKNVVSFENFYSLIFLHYIF